MEYTSQTDKMLTFRQPTGYENILNWTISRSKRLCPVCRTTGRETSSQKDRHTRQQSETRYQWLSVLTLFQISKVTIGYISKFLNPIKIL